MARRPLPIKQPLTTTTLIDTVAADLDISQAEAQAAVIAVFDVISRAAASGHNTAITNFGTFISHRAKRRRARNPQTGESVLVPAHQAVRFRPSDRLAEAVRRRNRKATIRKLPQGALAQRNG
ncbi:HU family DNA-binding protein [Streptomyces sp. NPDC087659]|uniref:HU family DNA-binding protein n=1 Tax=Streptomyces sp. NPDC087659 TaxID=3365801 RepID=UPI0038239E52